MTRISTASLTLVIVFLATQIALAACSDDTGSEPGATSGAGGGGSDAGGPPSTSTSTEPRMPPPGGRAPESGVSVIALSLPEQVPTMSKIPRLDASSGPDDCDADAGADACDSNSAPVLGKALYEIDGMVYDELPAELDARAEILVLVPFEDADCNLACGRYSVSFRFVGTGEVANGGAGLGVNLLPSNIPCGTMASGTYLGLYAPGPDDFPGRYEYRLGPSDACGEAAVGEEITGAFTVR